MGKIVHLTKEFLESELSLYKSYQQIAEENNLYRKTVGKYAKKYGLIKKCGYDLKNKEFGLLTVKNFSHREKDGSNIWICKCQCGNEYKARSTLLVNGITTSCIKCIKNNYKGFNDISGKYWNVVIKGAEIRNLEFNIKIEDVWDIYINQNKKCYFSDLPIEFIRNFKKSVSQSASIDRIDSSRGYTIDNIQIIDKNYQDLKWNLTNNEFINWCYLISNPIYPTIIPKIEIRKKTLSWKSPNPVKFGYFNRVKKFAQSQKVFFSIDINQAWNTFVEQNGLCSITKVPISTYDNNARLIRIDEKYGYEVNNIQWILQTVNLIKCMHSKEDFYYYCGLVNKKFGNKYENYITV